MKKRIYLNMALLTSFAILFVSIFFCLVFYYQFSAQIRKDLREKVQLFQNDDIESALNELQYITEGYLRATLILEDGSVFFDNTSTVQNLENHLERKEVSDAILYGYGESSRYSNTLGQQTYYYAVSLSDGRVLRLSKTTKSIFGIFASILPIILIIILIAISICYVVAIRLTTRIIAPINRVNLQEELSSPYDELVPFIQTINTQQKKIEADFVSLQKSTDTIHAITENMNEGMVMVGEGETILSFNKSAAKIFDIDSSFEGHNIRELSRDLSFISGIQNALTGEAKNMVFSKSDKTYNALISPVSKIGAILFFLDITEKVQAEKRRHEFSANVSHELKTPLTSIYGNAEMLFANVVKENDKHYFYKKIMIEASRLITLIDDIIMISELDEKNNIIDFEQVELADVALECVKSLSQKAKEYSINMKVLGKGHIHGNYTMIFEMMYNLLDNAIKYNKQNGSVIIEIEENEQTKITFTDTGIGIPVSENERIFERFYRIDKSRSKKTGGTGLGLAIVKHIVNAHSGLIEIKSKLQEGTQITIIFPKL